MTHASLCKKTYQNRLEFQACRLLLCGLIALGLFGTAPPATTIYITTTSLPVAQLGQQYLKANGNPVQLKATGGSGSYAWLYSGFTAAETDGANAYDGLTFNQDGTITGTPDIADTLSFSVLAENLANVNKPTDNQSALAQFTITITACTSTISPDSPLPNGEVGVPYAAIQFQASGCTGPYTYTVTSQNPLSLQNSYPSGLSASGNGILAGTPTLAGTFNILVTATDAGQNQTPAPYTITIVPPPSLSTPSPLPNGIVHVAYSQQITATGGTPPYTFSMNAQPPGIVNIDPNAGVISGTPTTPGTYSFDVGVTDSLGVQTVTPFQVTFVTVASQLLIQPANLTFNANLNGSAPAAQALTLIPVTGATPPVNYTVIVDAGQAGSTAPAWITVTPTSGVAPAGLVVSVNAGTLTAGTYSARIQVLDPIGVPTSVPVTLNVVNGPQQITVAPAMLNFSALSSTPTSLTQSLLVSNAGSSGFNTSVVSGNSLFSNVASSSGQSGSSANPNTLLQVQVNTNGLQVGAYHDTIVVSSAAGTAQIPVSLFVSGAGPILAVNTTGALFQAVAGGGSTGTQSIEILNLGDTSSTVNWNATLLTGSNWLSLVSSSGTATSVVPGVLTLALAPNATQLAPGPYYAIVQITDSKSQDSPQYVTAVLNLEAGTAAAPIALAPAGLYFTPNSDGSAPAAQQVQINTSSASPVNFNAAAATSNSGTWLSITPASSTASGQTAGSIAVSADPTSLNPGVYYGTVSVSVGNFLQSVNVTLVVPKTTACTASQVTVTEVGIGNNFVVPAGWPEPLVARLTDDCGNPITNGNVVASFSNGDAPLNLMGDSLGNYSATWQPGVSNSNMVITLNAMSGTLQSAAAQLFGGITPNLTPPPMLAPGGTLNNLNPVIGAPLSPGTIAQVYGSGLATASVSTNVLPVPTTFNNTYALVGAMQAPLFFLSNGQVDIQIPAEISGTQQLPIVLSVNNALTLPLLLDLIPATPGVLSANDGPNPPNLQNDAHIIAQHSADYSLVSSSNPAKPGEYLVMYAVGLGATNPSVASGMPAPSSQPLAQVTNNPTVTVGSQPATVAFAGLTPGFVGLYQINFQVPPSAASGELEVDVTQNGVAANPTLLPVGN